MKILREIITNPFGVVLLIVNFGLAVYCVIYENAPMFGNESGKISFHAYTPISDFLVFINYFPLVIIN